MKSKAKISSLIQRRDYFLITPLKSNRGIYDNDEEEAS